MASTDAENPLKGQQHVEEQDDVKGGHATTKHRTATLLSLLSLILVAEAVYRVVSVAATPKGHWDQEGRTFAPIVLLLAAIFELLFGTLGLVIGLGWSLFDVDHKTLTMALLGIQVVLGSFTYFVFTLAYPAYLVAKGPFHTNNRVAAGVFGWIFTAMGVDGIIQAGQFFLTLQFSTLQARVGKLGSQYYRLRLLMLAALVWFSGLGIFICGVLVRREDRNDLAGHFAYYPGIMRVRGNPIFGDLNAVRWPGITILSGILVMLYGLVLVAAAMSAALFTAAAGFGGLVWAWLISAHIISQYGLISGMLSMQAVITALLATSLVVVPLYYAKETNRNKEA